jgi:mannose-6-phosphate isomerase
MQLMQNAVRPYAWGSTTAIADLVGRPAGSEPEAEMWIGAHPADPSLLDGPTPGGTLLEAISRDPVGTIGAQVAREFGPRLPFLLKVLAADAPLSLQAHPSAQQAAIGFARENAAGIPMDSPRRNYKDASHNRR